MRAPDPIGAAEGPVLFFDDRCSVCRRFEAWALATDRDGRLQLARLNGPRASQMRQIHPELAVRDSALWLSSGDSPERPLRSADAILATLAYLGGPWRLVAGFGRLVPRFLRDALYRSFARHRGLFGWLGLAEPSPEMRRRLAFDREGPNRGLGDHHPSTRRSS
jgi:predicted DCC family thiol-disulfide oxidoreductase YuxK